MTAYVIRRLLLVIPTLLIVSLMIFFVIRLIPGDVIELMLAERGGGISRMSEEAMREMIEQRLGLDVPVHIQFGRWVTGIFLHGDLGMSLWKNTPITTAILQRLPVTFELGVIAIVISLLISFPIGIYSAIRQDTMGDYIGRSFAIGLIAIPSFWVGTMVVVFPSIWLNWSPPIMYIPFTENPMGNLVQFIIPGTVLGMTMCGTNMRMIRAMMLEVLRQDYIRTAWSKGLRERVVIMRHALKNALIPVITLIGLGLPLIVGGAVIIEQIFTLPGMGRLFFEAALRRDYPLISGIALFLATFILLCNLAVDLLYAYLDPRVQYR